MSRCSQHPPPLIHLPPGKVSVLMKDHPFHNVMCTLGGSCARPSHAQLETCQVCLMESALFRLCTAPDLGERRVRDSPRRPAKAWPVRRQAVAAPTQILARKASWACSPPASGSGMPEPGPEERGRPVNVLPLPPHPHRKPPRLPLPPVASAEGVFLRPPPQEQL